MAKEKCKAEYVACLERDAKRLHIEYLQRMVNDEYFISKDRNDRISYLLSKYNNDVPEEEKVIRQLLLTLIENKEGVVEVPISSQCKRPEDLDSPSCNIEDLLMSSNQYKLTDLSDKQLIKVCDRIGSDSGSALNNLFKKAGIPLDIAPEQLAQAGISSLGQLKSFQSTREELVQSATSCYNTIKANKETVDRLHLDYRDMMKDASFISKFRYRYDRINYLLRKHGITDEKEKDVGRHLLLEILDEEDSYILEKLEESSPGRNTTLLDYQSKQVGVGYRPTPEEVAKLPFIGKRMLKRHIGLYDGQLKLYRQYGSHLDDKEITPIIAVWSARENKWDPFEIYHLYKHAADGYDINDCVRKAGKYEHIFPLGPHTSPVGAILALGGSSKKILVGYNNGDDPRVIARDAIDEYELDESEYESIATILQRQVNLVANEEIYDQQHKTGYPMKLLLFAVIAIVSVYLTVGESQSSRKSTKKTLYVKSSATKNLNGNQGRKLKGLISKSDVQYIELEKKTGQPTVMYKIKASNGVVYVPVHIKGSEEAVEKAVVLIQEAIGTENVNEKIELPPTNLKQAATSTSKISSTAPLKISKKKKSTDRSLLSSIRSTTRISCQSLMTTAINTYKSATNYIGKGTVIAVAVLYLVLWCMLYWKVDCKLYEHDMSYEPYCNFDRSLDTTNFSMLWLLICSAVVLVLRIIAYGLSLMLKYDARITKSLIIVFVMLCCVLLFDWINGGCIDRHEKCELWASQGLCYEEFESMQKNCRSSCNPDLCQPGLNIGSFNRWTFNLLSLLSLSCVVLLLLQVMAYCICMLAFWLGLLVSAPSLKEQYYSKLIPVLVFDFISGVLRMPFDVYQAKKIEQTVYIKSSRSKNLSGKQGRKKNEIISKSGVNGMQVESAAVSGSHIAINLTGSRQSVRKAVELIREAVGTEHVSITKPSNTVSVQESTSSTVNGSDSQPNQEEPSTPESPVQREKINNSGNNLAKELPVVEISPVTAVKGEDEEEVPSEIGIDSTQELTRETITVASMSSLNDRSNTSKAYSSFTLDENDPLLIFLRSQESCIKGSVDEFYTWLVKSEDIDSMKALKEAVNEDEYLNDMKVGDGGGSGIKGFKRKAFLRAISEYFNDKSNTKSTVEVHQSLPQCQTKNLSDTVEPPEELVCPISLVLMTNEPVLAADGITYERASIEDWFQKSKAKIIEAQDNLKQNPQSKADQRVVNNGVCSPILGTKMENLTLMPHIGTRNMARSFEEKQKKNSP